MYLYSLITVENQNEKKKMKGVKNSCSESIVASSSTFIPLVIIL
jgi:hypothetical protein